MTGPQGLVVTADTVGRLVIEQSLLVLATGLVVLVLDRLLNRLGPGLRLALWALVLVRIVLPPGFGAGWSPMAFAREAVPMMVAEVNLPPLNGDEKAASTFHDARGIEAASMGRSPLYLAVGGTWIAGTAWRLVRVSGRRRRARAVARAAVPAASWLTNVAESWRRRWRLRRSVSVVVSQEAIGPFTIGSLRPVIVVPAAVVNRPEVAEAAVAHEMAHVARFDDLQLSAQQALQALGFFHPVVWWAGRRMEAERELCTDAKVLSASTIPPRSYALALLDAAGLDLRAGPQPALFDHSRRVAMRIERILSFSPRSRAAVLLSVLGVVAAAVVSLPLAAATAHIPSEPVPSETVVRIPEAPTPLPENRPLTPAPAPVAPAAPVARVSPLVEPLPEGRLTMGWGEHRHPLTGEAMHHRGTDLAAPMGTPIRAAAVGVVATVLVDHGDAATGRFVVLDHGNGLTTYYGHVEEILVNRGEHVHRGQVIATVGSTGMSTGPHLHFEVRVDGQAIDPAGLVTSAQ